MFTRQHYKTVAHLISEYSHNNAIDKDMFIDSLCAVFQRDNERFDKERFIEACYQLPKGERK